MAILVLLLFFEVSEIQEQDSAHDQSLVFLGAGSREVNSEVISITDHGLHATSTLLLDAGNGITRGDLKIEIDDLTAFERSLAVHTDLAAATVDLVLNVLVLVADIQNNVTASEGVSNLAEILTLTIFNQSNRDFGSVTTVEGTGAWSVDQEERFGIEFFIIIFKSNLELEGSALTAQELSRTAAGLFLALEELLSLLVTILGDGVNIVSVFTFTASQDFSEFHLLLNEDTISTLKSIETLLLLLRRSLLLRITGLGLRIARLLEAWLRISRLAVRLLLRISRLGITGLAHRLTHGLAVGLLLRITHWLSHRLTVGLLCVCLLRVLRPVLVVA